MGGVTKIVAFEGSRSGGLKRERAEIELERGSGVKNGRSAFTLQAFLSSSLL